MRKEISKWEQQVWKDNIKHIHIWKTPQCTPETLEFSGEFKDDSPIYTYTIGRFHQRPYGTGVYYREDIHSLKLIGFDNERDWEWVDQYGNSFYYSTQNPKSDRYPSSGAIQIFTNQKFQVAFDKIDRLLSFIDINSEFKGYDKKKELEFKGLIFFVLVCIRRTTLFPIEMVMNILSFIRICELR